MIMEKIPEIFNMELLIRSMKFHLLDRSCSVLSLKPSLFTEFMSMPSSSHFRLLCSMISRAVFPLLFFVSILAPKRSKFLRASSLLTSNKFGSSSQFDDSSQWSTESNWTWYNRITLAVFRLKPGCPSGDSHENLHYNQQCLDLHRGLIMPVLLHHSFCVGRPSSKALYGITFTVYRTLITVQKYISLP